MPNAIINLALAVPHPLRADREGGQGGSESLKLEGDEQVGAQIEHRDSDRQVKLDRTRSAFQR